MFEALKHPIQLSNIHNESYHIQGRPFSDTLPNIHLDVIPYLADLAGRHIKTVFLTRRCRQYIFLRIAETRLLGAILVALENMASQPSPFFLATRSSLDDPSGVWN